MSRGAAGAVVVGVVGVRVRVRVRVRVVVVGAWSGRTRTRTRTLPSTTTTTDRGRGIIVVPRVLLLVRGSCPNGAPSAPAPPSGGSKARVETAALRVVVMVGQVALSRMLRRGGAKPSNKEQPA